MQNQKREQNQPEYNYFSPEQLLDNTLDYFISRYSLDEANAFLWALLESAIQDEAFNNDEFARKEHTHFLHAIVDLVHALYGIHAPLTALPFYDRFKKELSNNKTVR